jgi:hypothetical protein
MLMLGMLRFRHGCMRLTGESTRTSLISLVMSLFDALFQRWPMSTFSHTMTMIER